ncbi:hypothetical protein Lser_V15G19459 [Lactuca serriola]
MAISYKQNTACGVRSISFPTTSHPITHRIENELTHIKTWVLSSWSSSCKPTTEAVSESLCKLSPLYGLLQELISSLSSIQNENWVDELMDGLVGFLDVCGIMRDIVLEYKGHVVVLQCALRKRNGVSTLENSIVQYNSFRKRITKDVKRLIASFKQSMARKLDHQHDHDHEVVIKTVKEVTDVTVTIFESLLKLFLIEDSRTPTENKWSIVVSKLFQKSRVTCEEHRHLQQEQRSRITYDFESLDVVCPTRSIKDGLWSWSNGKCQLETMEAQLGRIEDSLESIYMTLISTRGSLLNTVSYMN